ALMDDGSGDDDASLAQEIFDQGRRYDAEIERKSNEALSRVFGPELAHVVVSSSWKQEEIESVKESVDPKSKVVVAETSSKSATSGPSAPSTGGLAGTASNVAGEAGSNSTSESSSGTSTTNESSKTTLVGRETQLKKSRAPRLERLS